MAQSRVPGPPEGTAGSGGELPLQAPLPCPPHPQLPGGSHCSPGPGHASRLQGWRRGCPARRGQKPAGAWGEPEEAAAALSPEASTKKAGSRNGGLCLGGDVASWAWGSWPRAICFQDVQAVAPHSFPPGSRGWGPSRLWLCSRSRWRTGKGAERLSSCDGGRLSPSLVRRGLQEAVGGSVRSWGVLAAPGAALAGLGARQVCPARWGPCCPDVSSRGSVQAPVTRQRGQGIMTHSLPSGSTSQGPAGRVAQLWEPCRVPAAPAGASPFNVRA